MIPTQKIKNVLGMNYFSSSFFERKDEDPEKVVIEMGADLTQAYL